MSEYPKEFQFLEHLEYLSNLRKIGSELSTISVQNEEVIKQNAKLDGLFRQMIAELIQVKFTIKNLNGGK